MGDHVIFVYLFAVALVVSLDQFECTEVKVESKLGPIIGFTEEVELLGETKHVTQFLGVPYAKPPTGSRRFMRPESSENYVQEYNATYYRPHCMQKDTAISYLKYFKSSEDCLYLNIFTPGSAVSTEKKYSVMVFIHGGSFWHYGSDLYSGYRLSAFNDIVLVTLNYRLNTFGFLSNGSTSSGNMGLWDQKMAIQWVHDNIADFAGDPGQVTLFGQSAGAASVLYQTLNPANRGLFRRIIAESGSVLAQWAQEYNPSERFSEFANTMNCSQEHYTDILQCLQSKPAETLVTSSFLPVVDRDFIKEDPSVTFASENVANSPLSLLSEVDFLSGVANKDGAFVVENMGRTFNAMGVDINAGMPRGIFESRFIPTMLMQMYGKAVPEALVKSIILQYSDWSNPNDPEKVRSKLVDLTSDITFISPAVRVAKKHQMIRKADRRTYFYVFGKKSPFDPKPLWLDGAKHSMELPYVFGFPKLMQIAIGVSPEVSIVIPTDELKLSSIMMKIWTNFAKTGDPNLPVQIDAKDSPNWSQYDPETQIYLPIPSNMTAQYVAEPRMEFWSTIAPLLETCGACTPLNCTTDQTSDTVPAGVSSFLLLIGSVLHLGAMYM